jgi:probable HAF family extracellular repeat protein
MRKTSLRHCAVCLAVAASAATAQGQTITFDTTRVPTEFFGPGLETRGGTRVLGLNDRGQYVGTFGERNATILGVPHAFIHGSDGYGTDPGFPPAWAPGGYRLGQIPGITYGDPQYRYLDLKPDSYPSAFNLQVSTPNAINSSGVVVGRLSTDYLDRGPFTAFVYDSRTGSLQALAVPGATSSEAVDINASGQIVGNFKDAAGADRGFLYSGGVYTVINRPGYANGGTRLGGINDAGTIVGSSNDAGNPQSFIYRSGSFTNFTANGLYTVAADINNSDQIVGWVGVSGQRRGFFYQAGQSVILDLASPGSSTYAYTINNNGLIGGAIEGGAGVGFLATMTAVPEPATWALLSAGLAGFLTHRRRAASAAECNSVPGL